MSANGFGLSLMRIGCVIFCAAVLGCTQPEPVSPSIAGYYDDACKDVPCRHVESFSMLVDGGDASVRISVSNMPYAVDGEIFVFQGEDFRVQPVRVDDQLVDLTFVDRDAPMQTVDVSLKREPGETVLRLANPYPQMLLFRAVPLDRKVVPQPGGMICNAGPNEVFQRGWSESFAGLAIYSLTLTDSAILRPGACVNAR